MSKPQNTSVNPSLSFVDVPKSQPTSQLQSPFVPATPQNLSVSQKLTAAIDSFNDYFKKNEDLNKLSLVMFEVGKQQNSIFSENQRLHVTVPFVGSLFTLGAATLLNVGSKIAQPKIQYQKKILLVSIANFIISSFLGIYCYTSAKDLVGQVQDVEWARIQKERQDLQNMPFEEQLKLMLKKPIKPTFIQTQTDQPKQPKSANDQTHPNQTQNSQNPKNTKSLSDKIALIK